MRKLILTIVMLGIVISSASVYSFAEGNLLKNPSFEQVSGTKPEGWDTWMYVAGGSTVTVETGEGHTGSKFVSITSEKENDARYKQTIPVKENAIYKLSCWAKTENVGTQKSGAFISILNYVDCSKDLKATNDQWTYLEMYAKIGAGIKTIDVTVGLGGHGNMNTGKAFFDDVSVEEVSEVPNGVTIAQIVSKETQNSQQADKGSSSGSLFIVLLILIVVIIGAVAYFIFSSRKHRKEIDEETDNNDYDGDEYEEDEEGDDDSYLED
jgi:hypothetical protein